MVEYETIKSEEYKYGNNFLEVARKKTEDVEFVSVSKGFYTKMGEKKYKVTIGFPDDPEIKSFLVKNLESVWFFKK